MPRFFTSLILLVVILAVPVGIARADYVVLHDVPNYYWYYGCSPTAGMMVLGYWDANGFPNLIAGSNAPSDTVNSQILSLAGYMHTTPAGLTGVDQIAVGMKAAASSSSFGSYTFTGKDTWVTQPQWSDFIREIQYGRPVVLSVDSNADGVLDHSVAAIGYRTTATTSEYLCHDTYGNEVWYTFTPIKSGTYYGVGAMASITPLPSAAASTCDVTWKGASGAAWATSGDWTGGTPTSSSFVWLPSSAQVTVSSTGSAFMLQVQGGVNLQSRLNLTDLHILDGATAGGSVTLTTGTPRLNVASEFTVDGLFTQSTGTVAAASDVNLGNAAFTQSGGVHTVGGSLNVGWRPGSSGTYTLSGGQLNVTGGEAVGSASSGVGSFTQSAGTHTVGGLLDIRGNYQFSGGSLTAGQLEVEAGGRLAITPGTSAATAHVGSVALAATSTYMTRVSGTTAGLQYGQLSTTSGGTISGATLDLGLLYDPHVGDRYTLLTSAGSEPVGGTFAGLAEGTMFERQSAASLRSYLLQITYAGGAGSDVAVKDLAIVGDANGDGVVDGLDYGVWQSGYGKATPTFWNGDFNLDGHVDGLDYGIWQQMYSADLGQADTFALTPEPASVLLLGLGGLGLALRRRKSV